MQALFLHKIHARNITQQFHSIYVLYFVLIDVSPEETTSLAYYFRYSSVPHLM